MEEERLEAVAEAPAPAPAEEKPAIDIKAIIDELKEKGLKYDEIVEALKKLAEEGKIAPEELEEALKLAEDVDKEEASDLFGVDII